MKILNLKYLNSNTKENNSKNISEVKEISREFDMENSEMHLTFFSKGNFYLENGLASFKIQESEGSILATADCFGQLLCNDFNALINNCSQFYYNGSPVSFTVNFYDKKNLFLGQLISDSIFTNIGFGRGKGKWEV